LDLDLCGFLKLSSSPSLSSFSRSRLSFFTGGGGGAARGDAKIEVVAARRLCEHVTG
jgi:hypothetical protein